MKIVIHRPYFIPWMGYFSKLAFADKFIITDNEYFSKRAYIDRTKIINSQGEIMWLGLPVGQNYNLPCNKIILNEKCNPELICKKIKHSYAKAKHFNESFPLIENLILESFASELILSNINIKLIIGLLEIIKLKKPEIYLGSALNEIKDRTEKLIYYCNTTGCNEIIVGSEKSVLVHDNKKLIDSGIIMVLQDFNTNHPQYYQTRRVSLGFQKGLSILDCIFNVGFNETKKLLYSCELNYNKMDLDGDINGK